MFSLQVCAEALGGTLLAFAVTMFVALNVSVSRELWLARQETSRFQLFAARQHLLMLVAEGKMKEQDEAWRGAYERSGRKMFQVRAQLFHLEHHPARGLTCARLLRRALVGLWRGKNAPKLRRKARLRSRDAHRRGRSVRCGGVARGDRHRRHEFQLFVLAAVGQVERPVGQWAAGPRDGVRSKVPPVEAGLAHDADGTGDGTDGLPSRESTDAKGAGPIAQR